MEENKQELNHEQSFLCVNCNQEVKPLTIGIRNHCPHCLYSVHTDIFPNDNANSCHGIMKPVGTWQNENEEMLVIHKCLNCGKSSRAIVTLDDNYEVILKILNNNIN